MNIVEKTASNGQKVTVDAKGFAYLDGALVGRPSALPKQRQVKLPNGKVITAVTGKVAFTAEEWSIIEPAIKAAREVEIEEYKNSDEAKRGMAQDAADSEYRRGHDKIVGAMTLNGQSK